MRLEKPLYVANCGNEAVVLERFDGCWQSRWSCGGGCWWALSCSCALVLLPARDGSAHGLSPRLWGMWNQGRSGPGHSWVSWEGSPPSSMVSCPMILRNFQLLDEQGEKMAFNDSGMWDINQETITAMMFQAAAFQMDEFS